MSSFKAIKRDLSDIDIQPNETQEHFTEEKCECISNNLYINKATKPIERPKEAQAKIVKFRLSIEQYLKNTVVDKAS